MAANELGACEQFVYELRRSNLVERGQLDQLLEDCLRRNPQIDPSALAAYLIERGVLTAFQVERINKGYGGGLVLGPYVLLSAIGSGSMGTVHRVLSKNDGKHYALKVLPRRSMWNVRLARRQVRTFGQFNHPAVVPFVDVGTAGGLHYLVWNFVEGDSLDVFIRKHQRLDAGAAARLAFHIASGLAVAHQNGLFHGLLKTSNIMISPGPQVRILDFGIGSLLAENEGESLVDTMSTANTLTSGLDCASPESIMEPTNRTPAGDQYSLGCVLYYCLSGRYPFPEGSAVEKMMAHQFKEPTPIAELAPDTPVELVAILDKLLQKKPENRFSGFDALVEALAPLASTLPSTTFDALATQAVLSKSRVPGLPSRKSNTPGLPGSRTPGLATGKSNIPGLPGSRTPRAPSSPIAPLPRCSFHGTSPSEPAGPVPTIPAPQPLALPTRRSLRNELLNGPQMASPTDQLPTPVPALGTTRIPGDVAPEPRRGSALSPVGLISIGALVAVVSFFVFQQFMK